MHFMVSSRLPLKKKAGAESWERYSFVPVETTVCPGQCVTGKHGECNETEMANTGTVLNQRWGWGVGIKQLNT